MTVRQVFYQAVVAGLVEKTEGEYKNTVARLLLEMRRGGEIPYSWIADNTRWMRKPTTYTGLADFIERHQQRLPARPLGRGRHLRRDLVREGSPRRRPVRRHRRVRRAADGQPRLRLGELPLQRGGRDHRPAVAYGSAARAAIYYFGDYDRDGFRISASIEAGLRRLCPQLIEDWNDELLTFERIAVNDYQIVLLDLPTRPTKPTATGKDWPADRPCVELDAIPPGILRAMARNCIEQHVDPDQLDHLRMIEDQEREQLRLFGEGWPGAHHDRAGRSAPGASNRSATSPRSSTAASATRSACAGYIEQVAGPDPMPMAAAAYYTGYGRPAGPVPRAARRRGGPAGHRAASRSPPQCQGLADEDAHPYVAAVLRGTANANPDDKQVDLQLVFSPKDPLPTATRFVALRAISTGRAHAPSPSQWVLRLERPGLSEIAETDLRAQLYEMLSKAFRPAGKEDGSSRSSRLPRR